jgi:hypothetical protein
MQQHHLQLRVAHRLQQQQQHKAPPAVALLPRLTQSSLRCSLMALQQQ